MLKELNLQEMNEVKGGSSQEEYCDTVQMLIANNYHDWNQEQQYNAILAVITHCL